MQKVYVGLSGGVDSAVSAALLKERGFDVTGVFIKIWSPEFIECTWRDDRLDAMRSAVHLGIPCKEIDLSREYRELIVERMVKQYEQGITPNPDVLCNSIIKFGAFYRWAKNEGADIVATGHYARIAEREGSFRLLRGKDASKDQSYFIYELTQEQLRTVLFPIGDMQKSEVRQKAVELGLLVAAKPDSQGLCFVGDIALSEFLSRFIRLKKGNVMAQNGEIVGEHDGAALYTLGQRHGFRVRGSDSPLYVIATNVEANTIIVSTRREDAEVDAITILQPSWTQGRPKFPLKISIQTRYRSEVVASEISETINTLTAKFATKHLASPGQSAVFYEDDEVLGGAFIAHV